MNRTWIRRLFSRPVNQVRKAPRRCNLNVEALEDRTAPATFTVLNTNDTGAGSLRNAVAQANANLGADTILFDNTVFNTPQTIVLTSGAITFAGDTALTTVTGPGANLLSVSGGNTQGVWWVNSGISASISGMTVTQGRSGVGAVYNAGTLTLSDCTVTGNASTAAGGGVSNAGTLTMTNVTISASTAVTKGGALDNRSSATATLTDCTISGNTVTGANGGGGGLSNLGALTLTRCTVSGNSVTGSFSSSGGINTQGAAATLIAIDTTISGNTATDFGGGMSANGTVSLTNCTISGNTATVGGGGINSYTANTTMVNCTVSGNQTGASGTGGGVFVHFGSVSLKNVTVSDNTALSGGGIYHTANGTLTVGNTIVSGNTATTSPDVFGTINTDNGHNLFGAALSGTTSGTGNVFSDTPGLGALANNGGPTQTMALLSGSAAIDAGSNALIPGGVTTDQRGLARIINGTVDIGAFEIQSLTFTVTNANDSGAGSLRQAILDANAAPTADTIVFSSLFNSAQTITLTSGVLTFTGAATTTIQAPASNLLSVSGANTQQVFQVNSGASAALSGLTITAGRIASGNGGGVVNNGTLVLTDCSVSGNAAPSGAGGGIVNSGTATLIHSSVTNNTARGYGGGIRNAGTLTMTDCTVSGNTTTIQSGGGMYNTGTTTLVSCTVSSNTSANRGGGMSDTGGTTTLLNCTITGNFAQVNGGGVNSNNNAGPGSTTLTNCTVSGNSTAGSGGGLSVINNQIILRNTIVAGNTASGSGPDAFQTIVSSGNNLIGKTNGSTGWIASDLQGTIAAPLNPMLAALSDNGGLTRTMALLPGSPAIDAGANSFVASEAQAVTIIGSAGSFTLTFNGQTTTSILFNASAAAVQSALGLLSTIGGVGGSVTVTKSGSVYTVTFGGALAQENLPQMTASGTGGAIATVATVVNGATDQRGVLRTVNGVVDIGAFEWTAPTVAADTASVSASEGSSVTNTGTFHDENGNNTVLLTASIGTVIQHNGSGTWSWSLGVNDGPVGPFTVTITATDNFGATAVALFSYSGANVTPVAAITGPSTGVRNQPLTYRLTATDPGALDQAAGVTYQVYWDFVNNPGTFETIAPTPYNGAGLDVSHVYSQTGTFNIHVVAVDKDADSDTADLAGSVVITASALIENTLLVGSTGNDITVDPNNVTFGANIVAIGNANAVQVYTQTGVSQIDATTAAVPVSVVINDAFTGALTVKTAQTDNTIAIAPTSTAAITIVDGGGRNTLDFSTATTSSAPQGVTLNLNTVNQAQPINAQGGTINIHGKIQTVITSPNAASTIIAALPTVDTASQSVSGGTTVVAKGQDAVFTTLKTTVQAGSDSAIIGLMDRATFDAAVASLTDGQTGDVVSGPSKAFLQNAFATAVSIGFDDALIAAFDSELLAGFDAGQLTNLRNQITLQGTGATALVGLLTNVRATSVSKNTVVTVFDATAKALVSRGLANFEDQLSGGFSGAVRSAFDDSLTAGFEDLVAAGFEDELAGGFVSPTGVRLLQKAFDDVVSGGFEDDLAAGFDDGLAAGFSGGLTQAQRDFADDLLAGFQDDLAAGFESQLKAHFDDALEAGYRAILARGFDDSVAGGFDDALAAGFEDALAAGFDDALQGAFDDALQAAFDDAVDAGYDAAQARAFEDALAAGFTRMRSAAHFDDNLAAGFQDVLLAGFTQAMTTQFSAKLNSRFDDVLAGGFNDDLNAGFDDTLNAGFLVLKTGTNSAGNKFADELSAGFATDPAALNKFDDVLSSGFDDILEGGFEAALAGGFEDELTAAFGGDLTSVVKAFEDDLAAGFTIHLSTHFDDALAAGFDDALAGGFDDILAGGFEDALSSGFQQALRARFDDALAAGFDDALAAAFAAAAHPLTAAQSRAFEDALQAGFDDILAGGFDDALAAGFRDQLQSRFEDALAAGFRAQMLARFSATVPANFEDALNAGFQNLQSAGFEDALAGGFEDEIAAGFQTSVKSARRERRRQTPGSPASTTGHRRLRGGPRDWL
ncbi:MAG: right-handed parallel beta-helix repeat-containing protein [Gemmataceae bacterium]